MDAIAQQVRNYAAATQGAQGVQTQEQADAELANIRAQTAALQAAVASGQFKPVDPSTVGPGSLAQVLAAAQPQPQVEFQQPQELAVPVDGAPQVVLAPAEGAPPLGNFGTAFVPTHAQTNIWGGQPLKTAE
jgi:hypothetical protein